MTRIATYLLLIGALGVGAPALSQDGRALAENENRLFVGPFLDETDDEQYSPAATIMGDLIAGMLGRQPKLTVVERRDVALLSKEQKLKLSGLAAETATVESARLLLANQVLTGRLFLADDKLTIRAKVIELRTEALVASAELATRPEDLLETALQLSRKLAEQMSLPPPEIDLTKIDKSPLASLHFGKALSYYMTGNLDAALMHWMRTIDFDPDYVEAHYFSALAYLQLKEDRHAIIELRKFLERPGDSPHAVDARKRLAEATAREASSDVPRLSPSLPEKVRPKDEP